MTTSKRFTSAELAAEYQRARWVTAMSFVSAPRGVVRAFAVTAFRNYQQTQTIKRFASLPHYDED